MMNLGNLLNEIERIKEMTDRWSQSAKISTIERDLVLDKLKKLYEQVMFLEVEPLTKSPIDEISVNPTPTKEQPTLIEQNHPNAEATVPVENTIETVTIRHTLEEQPIALMDLESEAFTEPDELPEIETPRIDDSSAESGYDASEPLDLVESSDQKLFCDEPLVRQRIDKRVILSLYGDSPEKTPARPPERRQDPPPMREASRVTEPPRVQEPPRPMAPSAKPVQDQAQVPPPSIAPSPQQAQIKPEASVKVLGEVMEGNGKSLNDMLGQQQPHQDVASRISSSRLSDLHHGIDVNKRFLLLQELFRGDTIQYNQTIHALNQFTELDDAMIYIQENFQWNPDSHALQFLVELLERKLEA